MKLSGKPLDEEIALCSLASVVRNLQPLGGTCRFLSGLAIYLEGSLRRFFVDVVFHYGAELP